MKSQRTMKPLSTEKLITSQSSLAGTNSLKENFERVFSHYQELLQSQPDNFLVHQQLGNLMLTQRRVEEALKYFEQALTIDFEKTDLFFYYRCMGLSQQKENKSDSPELVTFPEQRAIGKINFGQQRIFKHHRSGWHFALQALMGLHNPDGVMFDGCLENQFLFRHMRSPRSPHILAKMQTDGVFGQLATSEEQGITPYQQPWVGFFHNPPSMPIWFNYQNSPQKLFEKQIWQASLPSCLGLFALSEYHAKWLRQQTGKPVSALIHPTEIPEKQFDFDRFVENPCKKIVQIGWWLRKLHSIYRLPLAQSNALGYEKVRLGFLFDSGESTFAGLMQVEARIYKIQAEEEFLNNTTVIQHIPDSEYDDLISENIAFVDLYDSSANNAIIECIARATPLLINPLPAVQEYLGKDYPMYFETLEEAAKKALDLPLILQTHQYLKQCETRQKLSAEYFLESFCNSEVYQLL